MTVENIKDDLVDAVNAKVESVAAPVDAAVDAAPAADAAPPNLSIDDLRNIIKILDLASRRGAFQSNELTSVGGVHDRFMAFLAHWEAFVKSQEEAAAEEAAKTKVEVKDEPATENYVFEKKKKTTHKR